MKERQLKFYAHAATHGLIEGVVRMMFGEKIGEASPINCSVAAAIEHRCVRHRRKQRGNEASQIAVPTRSRKPLYW